MVRRCGLAIASLDVTAKPRRRLAFAPVVPPAKKLLAAPRLPSGAMTPHGPALFARSPPVAHCNLPLRHVGLARGALRLHQDISHLHGRSRHESDKNVG